VSNNKLVELVRLVLTTEHSNRIIASAVGVSKTTVARYRQLGVERQLSWVSLKDLDDVALLAMFNAPPGGYARLRQPDLEQIHSELENAGKTRTPLTRQMLWEEYRNADETDACCISQFNKLYRQYTKTKKLAMRQRYTPGMEVQVDFSGKRPGYIDQQSGNFVVVELFVGILTFSNLTYATAVPSQKLPDWIEANVRMLEYFDGIPKIITCDNLKSAVIKAGRDLQLNRGYQIFARHYGTVVVPARPGRPRDKAKVEGHVRLIQRWVMGRLRHMKFFSLEELNEAIARLVDEFNERTQRRYGKSRRQRYDEDERAALVNLPAKRYEYTEMFGEVLVPKDYHVPVNRTWYSVPHSLVGEKVYALATREAVEIFHRGQRVASHRRSFIEGDSQTADTHCPPNHLAWARRTPEYMQEWATGIGESVAEVVRRQFTDKPRHEAMRACDSLRAIARHISEPEMEVVARYALKIKSPTVKSIRSISHSGIYRVQLGEPLPSKMPSHENIRGSEYYAETKSAESEGE
jgi:transposase